jgi:hypothetical protein
MDTDYKDVPLSESNVSLKLAKIQKRCSELLQAPDSREELSLEEDETVVVPQLCDPYNRG